MITIRKIKQLIPADGWFAEHESDGETFYVPVVCFALCESYDEHKKDNKRVKTDTYEEVCPMVGGGTDYIDFCEDTSNYKGLVLRVTSNTDKLTSTI